LETVVSDECCTTSIYYEPPVETVDWSLSPSLWADPLFLFVVLLIVLLIIALLALIPKTDKPPKTLAQAKEEIAKAADDLRANADRLNRPEVSESLREFELRVDNALKDVKKVTT
jgi:hypothetical protein